MKRNYRQIKGGRIAAFLKGGKMSKVLNNKTRQLLVDEYIKSLNEGNIPWAQGWADTNPVNAITGREYRNTNYLLLSYISATKKYKDHRWCTYKQAQKNHWYVKRGEKSTPIEFFTFYDRKEKKKLSIIEYNQFVSRLRGSELSSDEVRERLKSIVMESRNWNVFNIDQLEERFYENVQTKQRLTIDDYKKRVKMMLTPEQKNKFEEQYNFVRRPVPSPVSDPAKAREYDVPAIIDTAIKNMGVQVSESGDEPCYILNLDTIMMPSSGNFKNSYEWNSTLLHELCHATGHPSRLNRDLDNKFGSPEYAVEELRAEIGSSFLCAELGIAPSTHEINNHKAYIQSWIHVLKDDPSVLFKSINESDKIVDYVKKKGDFEHQIRLSKNVLAQRIADFTIEWEPDAFKECYKSYDELVDDLMMDLEYNPDKLIRSLKEEKEKYSDERIIDSLIHAVSEYEEDGIETKGEKEYAGIER
jgi:antirestriction protein ArdC